MNHPGQRLTQSLVCHHLYCRAASGHSCHRADLPSSRTQPVSTVNSPSLMGFTACITYVHTLNNSAALGYSLLSTREHCDRQNSIQASSDTKCKLKETGC